MIKLKTSTELATQEKGWADYDLRRSAFMRAKGWSETKMRRHERRCAMEKNDEVGFLFFGAVWFGPVVSVVALQALGVPVPEWIAIAAMVFIHPILAYGVARMLRVLQWGLNVPSFVSVREKEEAREIDQAKRAVDQNRADIQSARKELADARDPRMGDLARGKARQAASEEKKAFEYLAYVEKRADQWQRELYERFKTQWRDEAWRVVRAQESCKKDRETWYRARPPLHPEIFALSLPAESSSPSTPSGNASETTPVQSSPPVSLALVPPPVNPPSAVRPTFAEALAEHQAKEVRDVSPKPGAKSSGGIEPRSQPIQAEPESLHVTLDELRTDVSARIRQLPNPVLQPEPAPKPEPRPKKPLAAATNHLPPGEKVTAGPPNAVEAEALVLPPQSDSLTLEAPSSDIRRAGPMEAERVPVQPSSLLEGPRVERVVLVAVRDPRLKAMATEVHGRDCLVCGFNFDEKFGKELADGYIEVHHLRRISEGERVTDPLTDLMPLCANCHAMADRLTRLSNPPTSIRQVQDMLHARIFRSIYPARTRTSDL